MAHRVAHRVAALFFTLYTQVASAAPLRVVSLAPHVTEILYAIGAQDVLFGVTTQCDYPQGAEGKPKIGSFVQPNLESVLVQRPSIAFATEGNDRDAVERIKSRGVEVVEVNPQKAAHLASALRLVAGKVGRAPQGEALALGIERGLARLRASKPARPRYLLALQLDPIVSVSDDTWLGDLFREAGYVNTVGGSKLRYPVVSEEVIVARRPDVVFAAHEVPRVKLEALLLRLLGKSAGAVEIVVLPPDVFVRPGPRLTQAFSFLVARAAK